MPPRWMVEECSREFGQIPILGLPFAAPPTKDNMTTQPSQVNPIKPYGVEVKNAPAYWMQDILWTVLATTEQTGGSYALMEEWCPKHSGPPPTPTSRTRPFTSCKARSRSWRASKKSQQ